MSEGRGGDVAGPWAGVLAVLVTGGVAAAVYVRTGSVPAALGALVLVGALAGWRLTRPKH